MSGSIYCQISEEVASHLITVIHIGHDDESVRYTDDRQVGDCARSAVMKILIVVTGVKIRYVLINSRLFSQLK